MMFGLVDLFLQAEITLPRQKDTAPIPIVFKKSRRFKFTFNHLEYVFKKLSSVHFVLPLTGLNVAPQRNI